MLRVLPGSWGTQGRQHPEGLVGRKMLRGTTEEGGPAMRVMCLPHVGQLKTLGHLGLYKAGLGAQAGPGADNHECGWVSYRSPSKWVPQYR